MGVTGLIYDTKEQALYGFWSSFGLPAYQEEAVPTGEDRPQYPYITYEVATDSFGEFQTPLTASVWDRSSSLERITRETKRITDRLATNAVSLHYAGGGMRLWLGRPATRAGADSSDDMVRRNIININAEYI